MVRPMKIMGFVIRLREETVNSLVHGLFPRFRKLTLGPLLIESSVAHNPSLNYHVARVLLSDVNHIRVLLSPTHTRHASDLSLVLVDVFAVLLSHGCSITSTDSLPRVY